MPQYQAIDGWLRLHRFVNCCPSEDGVRTHDCFQNAFRWVCENSHRQSDTSQIRHLHVTDRVSFQVLRRQSKNRDSAKNGSALVGVNVEKKIFNLHKVVGSAVWVFLSFRIFLFSVSIKWQNWHPFSEAIGCRMPRREKTSQLMAYRRFSGIFFCSMNVALSICRIISKLGLLLFSIDSDSSRWRKSISSCYKRRSMQTLTIRSADPNL